MNETIFFLHIATIFAFTLGALRLGKEALATWICLQAILANLFVLKQISILGFQVTCSDVFAVGGVLGLNLMQEYFGKESSKRITKHCFYFMLLFAFLSQVHLLYTPSEQDTLHSAYSLILSPAPRLFIASLLVFFIVQKIDIELFCAMKQKMKNSPFAIRNLLSLCISQLLDTVLFTFIGLYGMVASLSDVIVLSFAIKLSSILLLTPAAWLIRQKLPRKEPVS